MNVSARKIATIVRCIDRARSEYSQAGDNFRHDFTRQDAAILNVTRACEAAIDLANMLIRTHRLGVPADARESFALIERSRYIDADLCSRLRKTIGFRNIAVHQYQEPNLDIVESVIREGLDDVLKFAEAARGSLGDG